MDDHCKFFEEVKGMSSSLAVNHMLDMRHDNLSAKVFLTKYEGTEIPKPSNIETNPRIGIGQVHMLGVLQIKVKG